VTLAGFRLSGTADRELRRIVRESAERWGRDAAIRYQALFIQAAHDLVQDPARVGVRHVNGRIHYHLRHARSRVAGDQVRDPRHLLVCRISGDRLVIVALVHDAMVEGAARRIEEGESGL
jgi:toxin ParE1/3/4